DFEGKEAHEYQPSKKLHPEIAAGKPRAARLASAAQQEIADDGDVEVPANGLIAMAAARARPKNAFFKRQAIDAHVEQTAHDGAEHEDSDEQEHQHGDHFTGW